MRAILVLLVANSGQSSQGRERQTYIVNKGHCAAVVRWLSLHLCIAGHGVKPMPVKLHLHQTTLIPFGFLLVE